MKEKIIKEVELWQYMQGTLTAARTKELSRLLEEDNTLQNQFRRIQNLRNNYQKKVEKDLTNSRINRMYDALLARKKSGQPLPLTEERHTFLSGWAISFSSVIVLAFFALFLFFYYRSGKDLIMVDAYQYKQVIINQKESDLHKIKILPENKVITSTGKIEVKIQRQALVDVAAQTKFKIYRDHKCVFELYKGKVNVETKGQKNICFKVNQFEINPVGTAFNIQNDEKKIVVFLMKGKLEIINKLDQRKHLLIAGKNSLFVYNHAKEDRSYSLPEQEDKLLYYKMAGDYQKGKEWQDAIFWYEQFLSVNNSESEEKYNTLYELGFLYYDKTGNKEKAFYYWNKLLYSPYAENYSSKLKRISR